MQVEVLRERLAIYDAANETMSNFNCFVDGKEYEFGTFFRKNEVICFCSVSALLFIKYNNCASNITSATIIIYQMSIFQ